MSYSHPTGKGRGLPTNVALTPQKARVVRRGAPSGLPWAPWPSQGVGAALPLQRLPKELEEAAKELNKNLICSGINMDLASCNWGNMGERGLRAFPNRRLSGTVAQGREIMAEFNE